MDKTGVWTTYPPLLPIFVELYNEITSRCENEFGYDLSGLVKVPFD